MLHAPRSMTAQLYVGGELDAHYAHFESMYPQPSAEAQAAAAELNRPFTTSDIETGPGKLQNNKAAGCDGLVAEFLTKAVVHTRVAGVSRKEFTLRSGGPEWYKRSPLVREVTGSIPARTAGLIPAWLATYNDIKCGLVPRGCDVTICNHP